MIIFSHIYVDFKYDCLPLFIDSSNLSLEKIGNKLLELIEVDLSNTLRIDHIERLLKLVFVHVLRLAKERIELIQRDTMVPVDI